MRFTSTFIASIMLLAGALSASAESGWTRKTFDTTAFSPDLVAAAASAERIIGGTKAGAKEFPFLVALLIKTQNGTGLCGGSIVAPNIILTAAHCFDGATGAVALVGNVDLSKAKQIGASGVEIHPNWDPNTFDFDVALLTLSSNVPSQIKPIPLITRAGEKVLAKPGKQMIVAGWGNTSTTGSKFPKAAQKVRVPIIATKTCNAKNSYNGSLTDRMICAGFMAGRKDSCQGDSGGPLFTAQKYKGKYVQVGIVSFGEGCAKRNFPGIYSRIAVLFEDTNKKIAQLSSE